MNYYENYNWYRMNRNINTNSLASPKEGFERGNMFNNMYSEYKGYQPQVLKPSNEQEKKLYELSAYAFAAHEMNLYLDLHPEDKSMFMLFTDYQKRTNRLIEEYEEKYGPLNINSEVMDKSFTWAKDKWPWEVRDV